MDEQADEPADPQGRLQRDAITKAARGYAGRLKQGVTTARQAHAERKESTQDKRPVHAGLTEDELESARGTRVGKAHLASNANWDRFRPPEPVTGDKKLGICCSGGGLRSAAFNLGALQVLREEGVLADADHLAAVSGGNYISAAHVITAGLSDPELLEKQAPWGPGSPEERRLRNHSTYLAPGMEGSVWLTLNLVYGMLLNFLPFFLSAVVLGKLLGWTFAEWLNPGLKSGDQIGFVRFEPLLLRGLLASVAIGFVVVLYRRYVDRAQRNQQTVRAQHVERFGVRILLASVAATFVLVGVPLAIRVLRTISSGGEAIVTTRDLELDAAAPAPDQGDTLRIAIVSIAVFVVLAVVTVLLARVGKLMWLVRMGAAIAGPGLLMVPFLAAANTASAWGLSAEWDLPLIVAFVASLLFHGLFLHNTRYSMHLFYKQRLSTVFAVERREEAGKIEAKQAPYEDAITLSETVANVPTEGQAAFPELIVCAAVNISDNTVPPGRRSGSFTFTAEESGGFLTDYVPTSKLEKSRGVRATTLTLPAMMAISGAAVSPVMGRLTIAPLRFLMALANVRLGVWLPNPRRIDEFQDREARRLASVQSDAADTDGDTVEAVDQASRIRKLWWHIVDGWREPGGAYVLREALGMTTLKSRYVYVSDGGHWENLGLVELLRRGCTEIICLDASGDDINQLTVLGSAVGLARSELGVTITIDPRPLNVDNQERGWSKASVVRGTFEYPGEKDVNGRIYYAKASMTEDAPWDLQAFKARDVAFPNHSTGDQFFDDERFESYRALGRHIAADVVDKRKHPPSGKRRIGATAPDPQRPADWMDTENESIYQKVEAALRGS